MKIKILVLLSVLGLLIACPAKAKNPGVKQPSTNTSCQLVEKKFVNKAGKVMDFSELYLRCSIQDYFIKLCESKVSRDDLLPYLNRGISVKMEIRDGEWDICEGDPGHMQSRIGKYAVINEIIK